MSTLSRGDAGEAKRNNLAVHRAGASPYRRAGSSGAHLGLSTSYAGTLTYGYAYTRITSTPRIGVIVTVLGHIGSCSTMAVAAISASRIGTRRWRDLRLATTCANVLPLLHRQEPVPGRPTADNVATRWPDRNRSP